MIARRASLVAVTVAVIAVLVGGCADDGDDPAVVVDDEVTEQLAVDLEVDDLEVDCPEAPDLDAEVEADPLECTATIEGQAAPVQVTVDDVGVVTADLAAVVIDRDDLQAAAAVETDELLSQSSTVECGETTVVVIPVADSIECDVVAEDGTTGVAVIAVGADGEPTVVELRADE